MRSAAAVPLSAKADLPAFAARSPVSALSGGGNDATVCDGLAHHDDPAEDGQDNHEDNIQVHLCRSRVRQIVDAIRSDDRSAFLRRSIVSKSRYDALWRDF